MNPTKTRTIKTHKRFQQLLYPLLLLFLTAFLCNCRQAPDQHRFNFEHYFIFSIGKVDFFAQLALSKEEVQQGLMYRKSLDNNHGMLFVFTEPRQVSFWMKNVSLPLDVGYFDSKGRLIEQYALYPYDETPIFSKSHDIQFVLEMKRDWFEKNQIKSGDVLDLEKVQASVYLRQLKDK